MSFTWSAETKNELAGSHLSLVAGLTGGDVPQVDAAVAQNNLRGHPCGDHRRLRPRLSRSERRRIGGRRRRDGVCRRPWGTTVSRSSATPNRLVGIQRCTGVANSLLLFSESNSRFLCEVQPDMVLHFEKLMGNVPHAAIGEVITDRRLQATDFHPDNPDHVIDLDLQTLKEAWQRPLRMD